VRRSAIVPLLLLLAYAVAFGAAAFGRSLPAFDDHPGQLYRLWHVLGAGVAPSAWNAGWWAGYPELQFYPPGFFYVGALIDRVALGALPFTAIYVALLWLTWLLPGVTAWLALARLLGDGWLALPGAFVALTLSAGVTSGVEGAVHVGMLPARLAWALLPLLLLTARRWLAREPGARRLLAVTALLVAAIVVTHPAHAPAAGVLLLLAGAAAAPGDRACRLAWAAVTLVLAAALTAFWTVPLLARLQNVRALAWGTLQMPTAPLLVALLGLGALAVRVPARESPLARVDVGALWPWAMAAVVAVDALVLEPLGVRWLPADRVVDGAWMAVLLAAGVTAGRLLEPLAARSRLPLPAVSIAAVGLVAALSLPGRALVLWPRAADWPAYDTVARGLRLDDLWAALRRAPDGRVLFVRAGVPLVFGAAWWRPHTHVTALAPVYAGRAIVNGTFTHPSPVAALVYRGSAAREPITTLVERLDGRSLFGVPLEQLDAATLRSHAERLGVSVVVALEEDVPMLHALAEGSIFQRAATIGPFVLYERWQTAGSPPPAAGGGEVRVLRGAAGAWVSTGITYYPLWRAELAGRALPTRPGPAWDLQVKLDADPGVTTGPDAWPVTLRYRAGIPETGGAVVTGTALLLCLGLLVVPRARGSMAPPASGSPRRRGAPRTPTGS
jgi:hypothetical protein